VETTEATLFRKIEKDQPTLLLDEVDAAFGKDAKLYQGHRAILNEGHRRGAKVPRMGGANRDHLVEFAVSLQGRIDDLNAAVDEVAAALARVDQRVDGTVSHASIVRYDAYEGTGGHQSSTVAFLDATRTGILISAIQGRDYARIYMKQIERGRSSIALSPEEQEAVERAMTP